MPQNNGPPSLAQSFQHRHTVHRIQFADDTHLAAISEDGCCVLYSVTDHLKMPVLQLALDGIGNSLTFATGNSLTFDNNGLLVLETNEKGILAVAHGFKVTIYGKEYGYGVFDRPSFEVAKDILIDSVGLKIALNTHPTLTNSFDSESRESLLSYAVQTSNIEAVTTLLDSELPSGLIIQNHPQENNNCSKESALTFALRASNRTMVDKLLSAISSGKIVKTEALFLIGFFSEFWEESSKTGSTGFNGQEECSSDESRCHFWACKKKAAYGFKDGVPIYCNSHKHFKMSLISGMQKATQDEVLGSLDNQESKGDQQTNKLKITVFKAIAMKFPSNFLAFLKSFSFENCDVELIQGLESAEMDIAVQVALPVKFPKGFWKSYYQKKLKKASPFERRKPETILQAQRIPFAGICRVNTQDNEESPLEVIVHTSASLRDYSIFSEETIVHDLVMLEWGVIRPHFTVQTIMYVAYYVCAVLLSWKLVLIKNSHKDLSAEPDFRNRWTVVLSAGLIAGSIWGLKREYQQFSSELKLEQRQQLTLIGVGKQWYLRCLRFVECLKNAAWNHFDLWNFLDLFAFSTQLVTDVMILSSGKHILGFAAVSMLPLTWKLYSYARAFSTVGMFVRIVQRSMMAMGNFLGFLGCWLLGFAFAFHVLLSEKEGFKTVTDSMYTVTMMIYGDFDDLKGLEQSGDHDILVYVMFQLMMLSSVVVMLNLLIAILSDSYQDVKLNALEESLFQLASIILELRKTEPKKRREELKWVHVLKPSLLKRTQQSA